MSNINEGTLVGYVSKGEAARILVDVANGFVTKAEAARILDVSPRTVGRWVEKMSPVQPEDLEEDLEEEEEYDGFEEEFEEEFEEDAVYHVSADKHSVSITKIVGGDMEMESVTEGHPLFEEVSDLVWTFRGAQESLKEAFNLLSKKVAIASAFVDGKTTVDVERNTITVDYDGYPVSMPGSLAERIIASVSQGRTPSHLLRFAEKLSENPSEKAFTEAFDFIESMDIDITDDGLLLCFKRVTSDYKDCYTRTFDNSPGKLVSVPRNQVDEDSNQTCSKGLHVCSKAYLPHYTGAKVILCEVHPRDIVSVPKDYYSVSAGGEVKAKMRVCKYKVLADVTDEV